MNFYDLLAGVGVCFFIVLFLALDEQYGEISASDYQYLAEVSAADPLIKKKVAFAMVDGEVSPSEFSLIESFISESGKRTLLELTSEGAE
ncbi:hypothetical protein [Vibrio parahaemolyticus]|uniref:hypothetical protein n=1 Tax=Vibrio parahaemolyticus TaxID=670 RepID=UPI001E5527C5|nr:hypothetical protein [Vibrio parahaemolyticus]